MADGSPLPTTDFDAFPDLEIRARRHGFTVVPLARNEDQAVAAMKVYLMRCTTDAAPDVPGWWPGTTRTLRIRRAALRLLAATETTLAPFLDAYRRADICHQGNMTQAEIWDAEDAVEEMRGHASEVAEDLVSSIPGVRR